MAVDLKQNNAARLAALAKWVESDPARLGGVSVFRGTRVPVKSLFEHLKAGDSLTVFLQDFPGVSDQQAKGVLELAAQDLGNEAGGK